MAVGLWEWQDDDAARLRREGKIALARCWDEFGLDGKALGEAAELARELDEPTWELLFLHWYVQQRLYRENDNLQRLQPAVERLADLAGDQRCQACPQRFCARESIANFEVAADPPGLAPRVLESVRAMASQVPDGLECGGCFAMLEVGALLEMGRFKEALAALDRLDVDPLDDNVPFLVHLYRASAGLQTGDLEMAATELERARAMLGGGADVNPDNGWFLREVEVRLAIADGRSERAEALLDGSWPTPPPLSIEAVRIALALAEAHAAGGRWQAALGQAERALETARTRGMVRFAAEAALAAAEACARIGDRSGRERYAGELELLLPQLASRDLDERARALGVG